MRNKTKIFLGSALAVTAGVITPLVTLVSCGNKKPDKHDWLSIDEKDKTMTIMDGNTGRDGSLEFVFRSNIELDDKYEVMVESAMLGEDNDFDVVAYAPKSLGKTPNEVHVQVQLKNGEKYDDIFDDSHATFGLNLELKKQDKVIAEQSINNLKINFYCLENNISATSEHFITVAKENEASAVFNLNGAHVPNIEAGEDVIIKPFDVKCDESVKGIKNKGWKLSKDKTQLIINFVLEPKEDKIKDNQGAHFKLDIRCVDTTSNNVYWDYKSPTVLSVIYTDRNAVIPAEQITDGGANHETGIDSKTYRVYYWKNLVYDPDKTKSQITVDISSENATIGVGTFAPGEEGGYKYLDIPVTFKDKSGEPLSEDLDISLTFAFDFPNTDPKLRPEYETCTFGYRTQKLDKVKSITTLTKIDEKEASFDVSLLNDSPKDYTYTYSVITKSDILNKTSGASCKPSGKTLSSAVSFTQESQLMFGTEGTFALEIIGYDENNKPYWKQTTPEAFTIKYNSSIDYVQSNVDLTDNLAGEIEFTLGNTESTDISVTEFTLVKKSGILNVKKGDVSVSEGRGTIKFVIETDSKFEFDGSATIAFNIKGKYNSKEWSYSVNNVQIKYTSTVKFIGANKEIQTEPGKNETKLDFQFNPNYLPKKIDDVTIKTIKTGESVLDVDITDKQYDSSTGKLSLTIALMNKDTKFVKGDESAQFDINFNDGKAMNATISDFKITFVSGFELYTDYAETNPGEFVAEYTFNTKNELDKSALENIKVEFLTQDKKLKTVKCTSIEKDPKTQKYTVLKVKVTADESITTDPVKFVLFFDSEYFRERTESLMFQYISPSETHVSLRSLPDQKVTEETPTTAPGSFLEFKIIGDWQPDYTLDATVTSQQQINGYPIGEDWAKIKEKMTNITVEETDDGYIATVPITFSKGLLYGETNNPSYDTVVQFNLLLTCMDSDGQVIWDTSEDAIAKQNFTLAYEYSPWTSDEISGDGDIGYNPETYSQPIKLTVKYKTDLKFLPPSANQIIVIDASGETPEILSTLPYDVKDDKNGTLSLTFTVKPSEWQWKGNIDYTLYVGMSEKLSAQSLNVPIYLHWDAIELHFKPYS